MDFINGQRLDTVWKDLTPHRRREIVEVVASYVKRFHMLHHLGSSKTFIFVYDETFR